MADSAITSQDRKVVKNTTVPERRAFTGARRSENAERDAARVRMAAELGGSALVSIPQDKGFATAHIDRIAPETQELIDHANALIDEIGHDDLFARGSKGGFIGRDFLPDDAFELGSPYMRFALDERVVAPVADYLGVVPVLNEVDVWYSAFYPKAPSSSQLWHLDHIDTTQIKVWIHLADIGEGSGPLTVLDAATSDRVAEDAGYNYSDSYRLPDDTVAEIAGGVLHPLAGPAGQIDFVDTSRCFHFGSRVSEGAPPRRIAVFQYLTPYAFRYDDHREKSTFRHLAGGAGSELERLVLGAA